MTQTSKGRFGGAYDFNKSALEGGIVIDNEENFDFTTDFSISLWMKSEPDSEANIPLLTKFASGTGWDLILTGGKIRMALRGSSSIDSGGNDGNDLRDKIWHHIVVVNTNSDITFYTDGAFLTVGGTGTWTATTNDIPVKIGIRGGLPSFNGTIDEIQIYDRALTAEEVLKVFVDGKVIINTGEVNEDSNGLVGLWHLNDNALDSSGQGNDGSVVGALTTPNGRYGSAYDFNGSTDFIDILGTPSFFQDTSGAISAWIKPEVSDTFKAIFSQNDFREISFRISTTDKLQLYSVGADAENFIETTSALIMGNWYHVVGQYNGSDASIYINGVLNISGAKTMDFSLANGLNAGIGYRVSPTGFYFNGTIDEFAIYNRALTVIEIQKLFLGSKLTLNEGGNLTFYS